MVALREAAVIDNRQTAAAAERFNPCYSAVNSHHHIKRAGGSPFVLRLSTQQLQYWDGQNNGIGPLNEIKSHKKRINMIIH